MKFDFVEQIKQKTDTELNEIFVNAKNYNPDFVRLAEKELQERNINLDTARQIRAEIKDLDNEQLKNGKPGSPLNIFFCFVLAIFGGPIAIYAGYVYSKSKTTNIEGQKFYVYDEQTRQFGKMIIWLAVGVILFFILRRLSTI